MKRLKISNKHRNAPKELVSPLILLPSQGPEILKEGSASRTGGFSPAKMCRLTDGQQVFSFLGHASGLGAPQSNGVAPVLPAPGARVGASLHAII